MSRLPPLAEWIEAIHDPAEKASEGVRIIEFDGLFARYEIAPIPSGWAIQVKCECDQCASTIIPWRKFSSREECVGSFVAEAARFFEMQTILHKHLRLSKTRMLEVLRGGFWGFQEPEVTQRA